MPGSPSRIPPIVSKHGAGPRWRSGPLSGGPQPLDEAEEGLCVSSKARGPKGLAPVISRLIKRAQEGRSNRPLRLGEGVEASST